MPETKRQGFGAQLQGMVFQLTSKEEPFQPGDPKGEPNEESDACDTLEAFPQSPKSSTAAAIDDLVQQLVKHPAILAEWATDFDKWSDDPPEFIAPPRVTKPFVRSNPVSFIEASEAEAVPTNQCS